MSLTIPRPAKPVIYHSSRARARLPSSLFILPSSPIYPTMKITKRTQFKNIVSNLTSITSEFLELFALEKRPQISPHISSAFPPATGGTGDPPVPVPDASGPTGTERDRLFSTCTFGRRSHQATRVPKLPLFRNPHSEFRTQRIQPNPT